ncbi:hypothetical protein H072_8024 [Dactylellina haptotyla CBS 200.50]|uniref:Methyltransferase domain-containing protein n=1 Tax=Dactylellina haptotyla (strain CBS 200.50) TaxID=1284197 RepID=S8A625_DACHA|nr:hypothetical protein H072_8024 [Dactylellina haptotyla CBS 200.50]
MTDSIGGVVPERILGAAKKLFSRYPPVQSLVASPDEPNDSRLNDHIIKYRKEAYAAYPYPCIHLCMFVYATIPDSSVYQSVIIPKLKAPSSSLLMDVGCGLGQDIRALVADGADPANIIGFELHPEFIQAGYGLWRDGPETENPLKTTFITGSIFDEDNDLTPYHGRVDIIHVSAMLHLFSMEKQLIIAGRFDKLLKAEPGAIITGTQVGVREAGVLEPRTETEGWNSRLSVGIFRHNIETFKEFWTKVGDGKWNVEVSEIVMNIDPEKHQLSIVAKGETILALRFVVTRL